MLLAIDTATQTASLAIYNLSTDQLLAEWTWQSRRRQTQDLLVGAQKLLAQNNLTPAQLTALAVTTGPGSFTGVRIAISAAKGIGLGLPAAPQVVGVPTLAITAAPWLPILSTFLPTSTQRKAAICAYLQAGRGRFNWVLFSHEKSQRDPLWRPTTADHHAGTTDEFVRTLAAMSDCSLCLVGESTEDLRTAVEPLSHVCYLDETTSLRRAGILARFASRHLATNVAGISATDQESLDTLTNLQPLYLQAP